MVDKNAIIVGRVVFQVFTIEQTGLRKLSVYKFHDRNMFLPNRWTASISSLSTFLPWTVTPAASISSLLLSYHERSHHQPQYLPFYFPTMNGHTSSLNIFPLYFHTMNGHTSNLNIFPLYFHTMNGHTSSLNIFPLYFPTMNGHTSSLVNQENFSLQIMFCGVILVFCFYVQRNAAYFNAISTVLCS